LSSSPGLTQGIGKAEDLRRKLYAAEVYEKKAEDFDNPRSEIDGTNEIMMEYRRMRAENQEIAKRIDATPEWQQYDRELQFEIDTLENEFHARLMDDMPMNKVNYETLQQAREEICEYYRAKHAPALIPLCQRINKEVQDELASGKLTIGEPDDAFIKHLHERRSRQQDDPLLLEQEQQHYEREIGEEDQQEKAIADRWSAEEEDKQREMAFVRRMKRNEREERDDDRVEERDGRRGRRDEGRGRGNCAREGISGGKSVIFGS